MAEQASKDRNTSIDLLRILSMVLVVTAHFLQHGGVLENVELFTWQYFFTWTVEAICYMSVNCYVLICGYFQLNSQFKLKKALVLLMQTFFYSATIYVILSATGLITFSVLDAFKSFLPVLTTQYWFITVYIGLYIFSPFLNKASNAMLKKTHFILIIVMIISFSLIPSFIYSGLNFGGGYGFVWFVTLYLIATYLRKYHVPNYKPTKYFAIYGIVTFLIPMSKFCIAWLYKMLFSNYISADIISKFESLFFTSNSILIFLSSLLIFLVFLNVKIKNTAIIKLISVISPLTLGVYLIHDNNHIRIILWDFLGSWKYLDSWVFIPFMCSVILCIFIICISIDWLRTLLFKKIILGKWLDVFCSKVENKVINIIDLYVKTDHTK